MSDNTRTLELVARELDLIKQENGGILRPTNVHEFAVRHPDSAIHAHLEWNDDAAAYQYRLEQIRRLIRVCVRLIPQHHKPVRAWVSLVEDRVRPGGGYRELPDVMSDPTARESLLRQALAELERFRQKYAMLTELAGVFAELDRVKSRRRKKAAPAKRRGGHKLQAAAATQSKDRTPKRK